MQHKINISRGLKIGHSLKLSKPEIIVTPMLEYSIIVAVESYLDMTFTVTMLQAANRFANKAIKVASSITKEFGFITNITPQYPINTRIHCKKPIFSFKKNTDRIVVNKAPVIPIEVAKAIGKLRYA